MSEDINRKYGREVVNYRHQSVDFHYLVALYRRADICFINSVMDGMNLVALEFIASQQDRDGVLLVSQFAGCTSLLKTPMTVNPTDAKAIAEKINEALAMPASERRQLQQSLLETVQSNTSETWARNLLTALGVRV
jgi:trehalose 6-phosphate synthase